MNLRCMILECREEYSCWKAESAASLAVIILISQYRRITSFTIIYEKSGPLRAPLVVQMQVHHMQFYICPAV